MGGIYIYIYLFISRAFSAYEENIKIDSEQEHRERSLLAEYREKLYVDNEHFPDPVDLKTGWIGEDKGMCQWPKLYFSDISQFYAKNLSRKNLLYRLECDYKEGKAYRYFTNQFVVETYINNISESSKYCIFRTRCLPSQRVNSKLYTVWAIVKKDDQNCPGGYIVSAYCTCVAGLLGSCNHVAGMLFRIESAILTGVAHPTCTSVRAKWVIPKVKKSIEPGLLSSFIFAHESYQSKSIKPTSEEQKEKTMRKLNYQVMSASQHSKLQKTDEARNDIYSLVKDSVPKSCFVELMEAKRKSVLVKPVCNIKSLPEHAQNLLKVYNTQLESHDLVNKLCLSIQLSAEEIKILEEATTSQAYSTCIKG